MNKTKFKYISKILTKTKMETKQNFLAALTVTGLVFVVATLAGCSTSTDDLKTSALIAEGSDGTEQNEGSEIIDNPGADDGVDNNYVEPQNEGTENPPWSCTEGTSCVDDQGNMWHTENGMTTPESGSGDGGNENFNNFDNQNNYQPQENYDNNQDPNNNYNGGGDCFGEGNEECRDKALKADYRDIERMQREIQQMIKKGEGDTASLETMLDELDTLKTALDNVTSQDEVDSTREQIWAINDELQVFRMASEIGRMEKELERQTKQYEKDKEYLGDMKDSVSDEWQTKIDEQLARMEESLALQQQMLDQMAAGEDWSVIDETRWALDDLRWAMDDFWWSFEEVKQQEWMTQSFNDVLTMIEDMSAQEDLSDDKKEILEIGKTLAEEGLAALEEGDLEGAQEIQWKLDELRMKAEKLFGKMKPKFNEMGYSDEFDVNFEDYSEDMSYEKMVELVQKILSANPDIIEQILLGDPMLVEKTLKILGKVPEDMQNDYLEGKADLIEMYEDATEANSDLENYKEEILGFNYFGDALDEVISLLEEVRDGSLTVDELLDELEDLKEESKEAKYEAGVVSFPDYDDSDWYYDSVENMTDFLKGKKTGEGDYEFAGGDSITFAETLKITLEKFGKGETDGTPAYGAAENHWSKGYYVTAEEMGITLLDPDHFITRGEMARLIVEATLGSPNSYSSSSFSDLSTGDEYFSYLETLHEYGVISGDSNDSGGMPTVRSNDTINRAETAKVINAAYEQLGFETMDSSEFEYLLEGL